MIVTNAAVLRLADMPPVELKKLFNLSVDINYNAITQKCSEMIEAGHEKSEQLDVVRFVAGLFEMKDRFGVDKVQIEIEG